MMFLEQNIAATNVYCSFQMWTELVHFADCVRGSRWRRRRSHWFAPSLANHDMYYPVIRFKLWRLTLSICYVHSQTYVFCLFVTCDIEIKVTTSRTSCLSEELFACHARFLRGRHRRVFVRSLLTFFVNKNVFTAMIHCLHVTYFADIQYDVNICCARSAACERFQYIFLRFVYNVCEGFCCAKTELRFVCMLCDFYSIFLYLASSILPESTRCNFSLTTCNGFNKIPVTVKC